MAECYDEILDSRSKTGTAGLSYSSYCDRELNRITGNTGGPSIVKAQTTDSATGKPIVDECALCRAVFENAKCLSTRKECGPNNEQYRIETFINKIKDKTQPLGVDGNHTDNQCVLNKEYKPRQGAHNEDADFHFGASPRQIQEMIDELNPDKKTTHRTWTGGMGWMGWSAIYFAPVEVLCTAVSNHVLCEDFVHKMRKHMCADDLHDDGFHAKSRDVIAALDYGLMGLSRERSTSKQACECAGFCTPKIDDAAMAGFKDYMKTKLNSLGKQIKQVFETTGKESLKIAYEESLIRARLSQCEGGVFNRVSLLSPKVTEWDKGSRERNHQMHGTQRDMAIGKKIPFKEDWLEKDELTSFTGNRIAYMGYCNEKTTSCFTFDEMNRGAISQLRFIGMDNNDKDTVLEVTDVDPKDPAFAEKSMLNIATIRDKKKADSIESHLSKFSRWHKVTHSDFERVGIVYAEVNKKENGVPQLVVVRGV